MKIKSSWFYFWLGMLVMLIIALVAIDLASAEDIVVQTNQSTIAWDRPTTYTSGTAIDPEDDIRYRIFIKLDGTDGTDRTEMTAEPVAELLFVVTIPQDGNVYRFGVQGIKYVNEESTDVSAIAWSDNAEFGQDGNTWGLVVRLIPNPPSGLRALE